MANFNTAFSLCNLADQKGLLHVAEDEPGNVLVTLGRNIVIRYRISDQKELNSWSTIQKLSSKVIYHNDTYYGVFNVGTVRTWTINDSSLGKTKKIKYKNQIHTILINDNKPVVLFNNGFSQNLTIERNSGGHNQGFLPEKENIENSVVFSIGGVDYLFLITSEEKTIFLYSVTLSNENEPDISTLKKLQVKRDNLTLLGYCFIERKSGICLITFWSDGFLFSLPLPLDLKTSDHFVGQFLSSLRLSTVSPVAMTAVSPHHLAVYGGDPSDEGALLALYNLDFAMIQAQTSFKLLQKPPRVWHVHGRIIIALGQRLVCVPYTLGTGNIASLVGTRVAITGWSNEMMPVVPCVSWEGDGIVQNGTMGLREGLQDIDEAMIEQGCSEALICETIIENSLEKKDFKKISWCLDNFSDIPEHICVNVLNEILTETKSDLIRKVLDVAVDETTLTSCLRNLTFTNVLSLLTYLSETLDKGEESKNLLVWSTAVLDSFYQQFVLSRDEKVLKTIKNFTDKVEKHVIYLNETKKLLPVFLRLSNKKGLPNRPLQTKAYCIERIQLYP